MQDEDQRICVHQEHKQHDHHADCVCNNKVPTEGAHHSEQRHRPLMYQEGQEEEHKKPAQGEHLLGPSSQRDGGRKQAIHLRRRANSTNSKGDAEVLGRYPYMHAHKTPQDCTPREL